MASCWTAEASQTVPLSRIAFGTCHIFDLLLLPFPILEYSVQAYTVVLATSHAGRLTNWQLLPMIWSERSSGEVLMKDATCSIILVDLKVHCSASAFRTDVFNCQYRLGQFRLLEPRQVCCDRGD